MLLNVGAVIGAITFGHLSEKLGRRRSMITAMGLSLVVLPVWAFVGALPALAASAFLMQVGVQGAWGIIPAHLNELSPDETRGLMPGFAYQLGILFAAPVNNIVYALRAWIGYSWALAAFQITNILLLVIVLLLGRENKGRNFSSMP
jgi:SHS family lactate transporter-like MFS transporter